MSPENPRKALGEDALVALGTVVRREARGDAPTPDRGRARAMEAFRLHRARGARKSPARALLLAAALAGLLAVVLALAFFPRAPLRFTLDGAPATAGSYVPAGAVLRFAEGSVITFGPDAGGRIAECGPHGARVLLESGTASFHVAHRPGARWSVEAGPFVIAVIGTAFDASWSPDAQALEVRLDQGEVFVRGPPAPGGVHLRAGQRLRAGSRDHELWIGDAEPQASSASPPPTAPAVTEGDPAPVPPSVPAPAAPVASRPVLGWPRRVAAGDFAGVVRDAEARGVEPTLHRLTLADLTALADAARYAGRADLSRRALLEERARFAGSVEARGAAFLLGRLVEDTGGSPDAALLWYDAYLREAPDGVFGAEALGRKLAALRRAGDPAGRSAAAEYLRRYPEGPYAAAARELLVDR